MNSELVLDYLITNIKQKVKNKGYSIAELSKRSGVSARAINYILNKERKPNVQLVSQIAQGLGCNTWDLLMPPSDKTHWRIHQEAPLLTEEEAEKVNEYIKFLKSTRD